MAPERWYYGRSGVVHGPVPAEDLERLAQAGGLTAGDQVCPEGASEWRPASQALPEVFAGDAARRPPALGEAQRAGTQVWSVLGGAARLLAAFLSYFLAFTLTLGVVMPAEPPHPLASSTAVGEAVGFMVHVILVLRFLAGVRGLRLAIMTLLLTPLMATISHTLIALGYRPFIVLEILILWGLAAVVGVRRGHLRLSKTRRHGT